MKLFKKISVFLSLIVMLGISPLTFADDDGFSDELIIIVKGEAENAGKISFRLTYAPSDDGLAGGEEFIEAPIPAGTSENDAAEMIANAFKTVLHVNKFDVDWHDGEKIQVEAKSDTPDFSIEIASDPLQGISIVIED
jgi:hypothetical protein